MPLISKDEPLKTSMVNVGYLVLKHLQATSNGAASLSDIASSLKKHGISRHRTITFALCFLYMAGTVDLLPPHIVLKKTL
jgi:hypothetical protein